MTFTTTNRSISLTSPCCSTMTRTETSSSTSSFHRQSRHYCNVLKTQRRRTSQTPSLMPMMMMMIGSCFWLLLGASVTTTKSSSSSMFVAGFAVTPCSIHHGRQHRQPWRSCCGSGVIFAPLAAAKKSNEMFQQHAGESNNAYLKRLAQIASDPVAFERMVMSESSDATKNGRSSPAASSVNGSSHATTTSNGTDTTSTTVSKKYQRAEDWEKEHASKSAGSNSWDERVQFDGQRLGNGFRQNEILRQNIHRNTY
jgi:hypothetical protein